MISDPWKSQAYTYRPDKRYAGWEAAAEASNPLRRHGYVMFESLQREAAIALAEKFKDKPTEPEGSIQHFKTKDVLACRELQQFALSPSIVQEVCMWLGAWPKIIDVSLWRSTVTPGDGELPQRWHRDYDDWRSCKLFLYLTDVDEDTGPHQYIPGSHREDFFERLSLPPDAYFWGAGRGTDIENDCDKLPRVEITGPAGTTFLTNNFGLHRGKKPTKGERMVFQVSFGLTEFPHMAEKMQMIREAWGLQK